MKSKTSNNSSNLNNKPKAKSHNYILLLVFFVCLLMLVACFAMLAQYSGNIEEEAARIAQQNIQNAAYNLRSGVEIYKAYADNFGATLLSGSYEDEQDFSIQMHRISRESRFGSITWVRYYKLGAEFNVNDDEFDISMELPEILNSIEKNELCCIGAVPDRQFNLSSIAYCVPLHDFEYADAVIVFFWVRDVAATTEEFDRNYMNSRLTVYCTPEGEIVKILHAEPEMNIREYGDVYEILRSELNDKLFVDNFRVTITNGNTDTFNENVAGDDCIFTVSSVTENNKTLLSSVGYYKSADLYPTGYAILRAILGTLLVFFIVAISVTLFVFIQRIITRRRHAALADTNLVLGCYSRSKFESVSYEIIQRNKATMFAVVVIDVNHYSYIHDQFGMETTVKILKYLELLYSRILQLDETYGYAENGRFLLLLHYRDLKTLEQRIYSLIALASEHSAQMTDSVMLSLLGGVYTTEKNLTDSVSKMVDLAIEAENATRFPYDFGQFRYYNELLHSSAVQNDYIELHMESALQNHDFKVFYQAKYNILEKRPDGCEALVRWYNPELDEYMQPDVFLPLFEANHFIVKLDHYVFEQVCLYIEDAVLNGLPLYPVSINASRITATSRDFVSFYTETKKKHNIADGFLTIEFTESFAYEDYDKLRETVNVLHKNGFKCSIDDFGSGFSSYNILKELPMDEIKLDRFFIKEGYSPDRDLKVLSSIISLARELHMKVTQEGVEHQDQVELLKNLGCQVIQGYYYSKPLSLTDYTGFLDNSKVI